MVNRLSVKVSGPRMDGSSVWSVGGLIVAAGRLGGCRRLSVGSISAAC